MTSLIAHRKPAAEHSSVFHTESWHFIQEIIQPVKNLMLCQPFPQVRATCDSNITKQESWQMEEGHLPKGQLPSLYPPVKSNTENLVC